VGQEIVALRIKGKGSVFQDVPVPGRLSQALLEWKALQENFKGHRILGFFAQRPEKVQSKITG
jgi:hypothetical protein